jgi:segregation and condensation protein B
VSEHQPHDGASTQPVPLDPSSPYAARGPQAHGGGDPEAVAGTGSGAADDDVEVLEDPGTDGAEPVEPAPPGEPRGVRPGDPAGGSEPGVDRPAVDMEPSLGAPGIDEASEARAVPASSGPPGAGPAAGEPPSDEATSVHAAQADLPSLAGQVAAASLEAMVVHVPDLDVAEKATNGAAEADQAASQDGGGAGAAVPVERIESATEAILFVADRPVTTAELAQVLGVPQPVALAALEDLRTQVDNQRRGFELREIAGGWRLYTREEFAPYVEAYILDGQQARLTQAALETLAVVAYRQPVTRSRISAIRGVSVDGVIRTLLTRGLIEECGSEPETGGLLYRTTPLFLEKLGLQSLEELPSLAPLLPELDTVEDVAPST